MRRRWTLLLVCCLISDLTQAEEKDPGYGLLAYRSDPAPYATGAGPAGGWGIGAASANPAALMFGPQSTLTAAPLLGPVLLAGGTRVSRHLRLGASVDYVPEFDRNSWLQSQAPSGRYSGTARRGDLLMRLNVAIGVADRAALGFNVKYLKSTNWWTRAPLDLLAIDLGLRFDAVWPAASLIVDHGSMLPSSRGRWPAGFSFGIAGINVPVTQRGVRAGDMEVPTWWSAGVTYRAIVSRPLCLSLGGTLLYWPNVDQSLDPYAREPKWSNGAYSVGMGLEINELLEAGMALYGPGRESPAYYEYFGQWYALPHFEQDNMNLEIYAGIGPPWLRILVGGGMYGKPGDTESDGRLWIRSQFPFGEGTRVGSTFFN
jgi:hypothetical protein